MLMQKRRDVVFLFLLTFSCFPTTLISGATLPPEEIDALKQIGQTLGKDNRNFSANPCSRERGWGAWLINSATKDESDNNVTCNCTYQNNTVCHVVSIILRGQNLQGVLPSELAMLPFLKEIDLTRNYLNGTIPLEWGSIPLENISLLGNRITGPIPKELWNIVTLTNLVLEANKFSGESAVLFQRIEKLVSIKRIIISSNAFLGQLPTSLANLTSLTDLAIQGSGLQGPIPAGISSLVKLTDLRISDINGIETPFPKLDTMKRIRTLILRNCNLTGSIPDYIWKMEYLQTLDLSFNMLEGTLLRALTLPNATSFIYLTRNLLSGHVPKGSKNGDNVDLSYNDFIPASTKECQEEKINLFGSSPTENNLSGAVPPCLKDFDCQKSLLCKFYINCGGGEVNASVNGTHRIATFTEDQDSGGASRFVLSRERWAFSNTGNFLDDEQYQDLYIGKNISRLTMPDSQLYMTARLSPLSLTYYGLCLWNGNYTVKLHFAEIMFSDDESYNSLGKRIFDIYIQGKLVWKDFNIVAEAGGTHKAVVRNFTTVVTTNTLEIRFYWAGKGTQCLPVRGTYGPLISAISVESVTCCDFTPPGDKKISVGAVIGIIASVFCVIFLIIGILWWKGCFRKKSSMYEAPIVKTNNQYAEIGSLPFENRQFTYAEVLSMTNNFQRCIGKGGFGTVYHGQMTNGTQVAVKMLSPGSIKSPCQGSKEFQNETAIQMH